MANSIASLGAKLLLADFYGKFIALRQKLLNKTLSGLYGSPVVAAPVGQVGVAAALVLWTWQDGVRHLIMVRDNKGTDTRARFISAYGLHGKAHMGEALLSAVRHACGSMFMQTFKPESLALDRVAAVPMFTATDEATGHTAPVQALVWCQQLQPAQTELITPPAGLQLVLVPEFGLSSSKVSPTHRALVQALGRHFPPSKLPSPEATPQQTDDAVRPLPTTPRVVH